MKVENILKKKMEPKNVLMHVSKGIPYEILFAFYVKLHFS